MRGILAFALWLGLFGAGWAAGATAADTKEKDVTAEMEKLGNPFLKSYQNPYARNVWSMKAFDGKLFAGAANYDNGGPGAFPQKTQIFAFDPATKKFALEYTAPDDQLYEFRVINGDLYVPGCDPTADWSMGNFYTRKAGSPKWEMHRVLPEQLHTWDMCARDGKIFTCGYHITVSADGGKTFSIIKGLHHARYYAFMVFPNNIYSFNEHWSDGTAYFIAYEHKEKTFVWRGRIAKKVVMPDTKLDNETENSHLIRTWSFKDKVLYNMGTLRRVVGGYCAADGKLKQSDGKVTVKGKNGRPRVLQGPRVWVPGLKVTRAKTPPDADYMTFAVTDAKAYLCYAVKTADDAPGGKWRNHVMISDNGLAWKPLLAFDCPTFARSIEVMDGFLYFGLGANFKDPGIAKGNDMIYKWSPDELSPAAGEIWRVKLPE